MGSIVVWFLYLACLLITGPGGWVLPKCYLNPICVIAANPGGLLVLRIFALMYLFSLVVVVNLFVCLKCCVAASCLIIPLTPQ